MGCLWPSGTVNEPDGVLMVMETSRLASSSLTASSSEPERESIFSSRDEIARAWWRRSLPSWVVI
jgi:hypothetical protein